MSDSKLYVVTLTTAVVVAAPSLEDAEDYAMTELPVDMTESGELRGRGTFFVHVEPMLRRDQLPSHWSGSCRPYGGDCETVLRDYPAWREMEAGDGS